jgi:hypothetical protein
MAVARTDGAAIDEVLLRVKSKALEGALLGNAIARFMKEIDLYRVHIWANRFLGHSKSGWSS